MMRRLAALLVLLSLIAGKLAAGGAPPVVIGSKAFTEGVILGEIGRLALLRQGISAEHRRALGGTRIVYGALLRGEIDAYAEYTGTLRFEIFAGEALEDHATLAARLARDGLALSPPLGFENAYALATRPDLADRLGIETVSDLAAHPELRFGITNEFMDRGDGWPALKAAYGLPHRPDGLEQALAYRGAAEGRLDIIDVYTTDAEIPYYGLRLLADDRDFFPDYEAVFLYRRALEQERPEAAAVLRALAGSIDARRMQAMNKAVKIDRLDDTAVAAEFLGVAGAAEPDGLAARIWRRTVEHLALVAVSLSAALLVAIPMGILAQRRRRIGTMILSFAGLMQTIPALALFVFMIPLLGIGAEPTIAALFLYSLLPIVRNTHAGLAGIAGELRESALALGLSARTRLLRIELPLALPTMLAGIKTAAVINVGAATLGALIGAGGLGQPILTGIRLDDIGLILEGAIPAALLALAVTGLFDLIEHAATPRGLRIAPQR